MTSYFKKLFVGGCILTLAGCGTHDTAQPDTSGSKSTQWVNPDYSPRNPQPRTGVFDGTNQNLITQQLGSATRSAQNGDCNNSLLYQRDAAMTLQGMAQRVMEGDGQSASTDLSNLFLGAAEMFSSLRQFTIYCGPQLASQLQGQGQQRRNMGYVSSMRSLSRQAETLSDYMSTNLRQGNCDQAMSPLSTVASLPLSMVGRHTIPFDFDQQSAYLDALENGETLIKVGSQVLMQCQL